MSEEGFLELSKGPMDPRGRFIIHVYAIPDKVEGKALHKVASLNGFKAMLRMYWFR